VIDSVSLFQGRKEVVIVHDGHEYRLRITRQNKLILTK
jgi:hemin uptake protein HemP